MAANNAGCSRKDAVRRLDRLVHECVEERAKRLGWRYGEQVRRLFEFLRTRTDFLTAPASAYYHLSIPGGLVMHSVAVAETAVKLRDLLMPDLPLDSVLLTGLAHDAGKVWAYTKCHGGLAPRYIENGESSIKPGRPYRVNDGDNGIDPTIKNLLMVHRFVELSDAEAQCLFYSDGPHVAVSKSAHHRQHPLSLVIAFADEWNGRVVEGNVSAGWLSGMFRDLS